MKGSIQVIEGKYLATVDEAVFISGSNKNLKEKLSEIENEVLPLSFSSSIKKIKGKSINLFNKLEVEKYTYYDDKRNGTKYVDGYYCGSEKIKVKEDIMYTIVNATTPIICFYREDDSFISGTRSLAFRTPLQTSYIRLSLKASDIETAMLIEGNTTPDSYIECVPHDVYSLDKYAFKFNIYKDITEDSISDELKEKLISETEKFENAIPKIPLHLETYYDGANEPYHPSIVKFDSAWNGYKYWMAYTPFPDEDNENPCIACSNDLIKWETPNGLTNPIDSPSQTENLKYWSDTHLVYNNDLDRLEVYYRGDYTDNIKRIVRKTSNNGVNWGERESVFDNNSGTNVSPSIIYENGKYIMWFCVPSKRYESSNGLEWNEIANCSYFPDFTLWHQDIIKTDVGYELTGMEGSGRNTRVIHYTSTDGLIWKDGKELVKVLDNNKYGIKGFYKPCLIKENGFYYLFLSINWTNDTNGMSLSISSRPNDITSLKGINQDYIPYMAKYTKKGKSGFEGQVIFDKSLNKMIYCKKGGRNAVWVDFNGNTV